MNLTTYQEITKDLEDRFVRYVKIDTQSDPDSKTVPSTEKQKDLALILVDELKALGLNDSVMDDKGFVYATLESNLDAEDSAQVPVVGFIAHMDTSHDASGTNVKPRIHRNYGGGVITLENGVILDPKDHPELSHYKGDTIITSDGTTLLGADDKAGVAEIMSALVYLLNHPEIKHGKIKVAFTPDEEIGTGADSFDIPKFGAKYAYTLDGGKLGNFSDETFSAKAATITIKGVQIHPGDAYGKMINPSTVVADLVSRLPASEQPETTKERDGFYCVTEMTSDLGSATIKIILRDFDDQKLEQRATYLQQVVAELNDKYGNGLVSVEVKDQYPNMKKFIAKTPEVSEIALEAIARLGIEPKPEPTRGGTDGSKLSARNLPTPNLFTGMHNYHSQREYVPVGTMVAAVGTIVEIAKGYVDRYGAK